jgi:hypothetical protein
MFFAYSPIELYEGFEDSRIQVIKYEFESLKLESFLQPLSISLESSNP